MSFDFTPNQTRAIEDRSGTILVSAAAGSGKTRVLTERLIRAVTEGADIDRFLVITYTRAAAAELRGRILERLASLAARNPGDRRLRRQQTLCWRAPIGTIHSFCTSIIRENCHLLGIAPGFRVLEEERAQAMKAAALDRVLEQAYAGIETDARFRLLADTLGAGRDDSRLQRTLLRLLDRLRSHPYPEDWAAQQRSALKAEGLTDALDTVWGQELASGIRADADWWAGALEGALARIHDADERIRKAYGPAFAEGAALLRDFSRALSEGWDKGVSLLPLRFPRLSALRGYDDEALQGAVKAVWDGAKKAAAGFADELGGPSAAQLADLRAAAPAMERLLELTLELDRAYRAEKDRRGVLDFSDLEHYAVLLLAEKGSNAPTPAALELSGRYREIMVDEYQDVNAMQELIFRAVSRAGQNLFLVGDVKQSIYRFRLADPGLFLEKYRNFTPVEAEEEKEDCRGQAPGQQTSPGPQVNPELQGRRILLQENFRSRKSVLDAANLVFSNIMSKELGEMDYDADAALRFGARVYGDSPDTPAELCILDGGAGEDGEEDAEPPDLSRSEAEYVARRILEMMRAGTPVHDGDGVRPCRWGDFALLLRSPGGKGGVFHRALERAGIPVQSRLGGGFFASLEITTVMSLLTLIDNPHADVPLVSALRSPAFGFTGDELTALRAANRESDLYDALLTAAENGNARCREVLERLTEWRALAPDLELDALIWRVCADTQLLSVCSAMHDGANRRRNLLRLLDYARSFTESGYRGVFRFLRWMKRLADAGTEPDMAAEEDAVRIMSIHRSKGLEFPFVFLCDLQHRFNLSDAMESVLVHAELGLGPQRTDLKRGIEYPTLARRAIRRRLVTESLSEEMRVLYVGMTRAKERLVMTCAWKNAAEKLDKLRPGLCAPLPPSVLRGASSFSRWLAMAALLDETVLPIRIVGSQAAEAVPPEIPAPMPADSALEQSVAERLDFRYPFPWAVELPSWLTATELEKAAGDTESASLVERTPEFSFRAPKPDGAPRLNAAARGTATHTFLQHLDFARTDSPEQLRDQAQSLCAAGFLTEPERDAIDLGAVSRLFASPLGRRMKAAKELRREFRFTLLEDAGALFPGVPEGETLLMQGVVDCFFVEDGAVTIVDYKTDRVSAQEAPERAERYRAQVRTYARALRRILGLPVRECLLWFLTPGTAVALDAD